MLGVTREMLSTFAFKHQSLYYKLYYKIRKAGPPCPEYKQQREHSSVTSRAKVCSNAGLHHHRAKLLLQTVI